MGIFAIKLCLKMRTDGKTELLARFSTAPSLGKELKTDIYYNNTGEIKCRYLLTARKFQK